MNTRGCTSQRKTTKVRLARSPAKAPARAPDLPARLRLAKGRPLRSCPGRRRLARAAGPEPEPARASGKFPPLPLPCRLRGCMCFLGNSRRGESSPSVRFSFSFSGLPGSPAAPSAARREGRRRPSTRRPAPRFPGEQAGRAPARGRPAPGPPPGSPPASRGPAPGSVLGGSGSRGRSGASAPHPHRLPAPTVLHCH